LRPQGRGFNTSISGKFSSTDHGANFPRRSSRQGRAPQSPDGPAAAPMKEPDSPGRLTVKEPADLGESSAPIPITESARSSTRPVGSQHQPTLMRTATRKSIPTATTININ